MENAKDPYAMNQYPQQPFVGHAVPIGTGDQPLPVGQPYQGNQYAPQYPPNQYPNQYQYNNQYQPNQYPPYQGQMPPPMANPQNIVIVDPNMLIRTRPTQRVPEMLHCKRCNVKNLSRIQFEPGNGTWVVLFGMCVFGCWPCCLVPLCMQDCQDCKHFCSVCGEYLGKRKFLIDEDY